MAGLLIWDCMNLCLNQLATGVEVGDGAEVARGAIERSAAGFGQDRTRRQLPDAQRECNESE
jgi:hypothetical protein